MGRVRKPRAVAEMPAQTVETLNGGLSHEPTGQAELVAFPDEEAEPRHPELDPTLTMRVANDERIARAAELLRAVGMAGSTPPAPAARRPAPRRVSAEVVKAETALLNLERRRADSLAHAESVWAAKRVALIRSFPADVLAALEAMSVLDGDELEGIDHE